MYVCPGPSIHMVKQKVYMGLPTQTKSGESNADVYYNNPGVGKPHNLMAD